MQVALIVYALFLPIGEPGWWIEGFETRKACEQYISEGGGWLMARATFGLNSSPDPISGFQLACMERA